ncbi:FAD-dependent oxidoreductase [Nocardia blacklockiae]|uniref:FAD-dependent oxidoreductase n=1 Tax=Nocardia blacklockiae TaxID=480036 RepID=UPI0018951FF2|nr:FAD-dependent oxidoreductase [Nocardia blacklockiae]MBF6175717.1 FAD-dependent oxidoreductase [Nocardia blacklockiae]
MTSIWLRRPRPPARPPLTPGQRFDVLVVGGGLTGLTTALLLAERDLRVAVVEARRLGAVTTGNTTGKVSLLQGTRAGSISRTHGIRALHDYLAANRAGMDWLLRYCDDHAIAVQREPAYTYAQTPEGTDLLRAELDATRKAGLPTRFVDDLDVPFPVHGAVRLDDQAQLDAIEVIDALAADLDARGVPIFEETRVRGRGGDSGADHVLHTDRGDVAARTVVLATGTPILDRGGFFARVTAQRSYAAAFRVTEPIPGGMYLSADDPTRSIRYAPTEDGTLLLVGGSGHPVGRTTAARAHADDVVEWTRTWFPSAEPVYRWSAQDYRAGAQLPYAGPILPGNHRILVATGYAKWGLTNAVAAAHVLAADIAGERPPWAGVFTTWGPRELAGLPTFLRDNGAVGLRLSTGWAGALAAKASDAAPPEGTGRVERRGLSPTAVSTVDGRTRRISAVCPHLGGVLCWNDAEHTWDCPLHGSRFAPDGTLLEGPATHPAAAAGD